MKTYNTRTKKATYLKTSIENEGKIGAKSKNQVYHLNNFLQNIDAY